MMSDFSKTRLVIKGPRQDSFQSTTTSAPVSFGRRFNFSAFRRQSATRKGDALLA